jgi:ABC-type cobalt transport system substrate-binding protein
MKKINPQYEPITDLLEEIYGEVQEMLTTSNENYRKIS